MLVSPDQIAAIIAYLFPYPFTRCSAPEGKGCIPGAHLGL